MREAFDVARWCRTIGNMLVHPANSRLFFDFDNWQMRGYFDRMLKTVYSAVADTDRQCFIDYVNDSMLTAFVDADYRPKDIFAGVSIAAKDFWPTQLSPAIHEMYVFCKRFIPIRSAKIVNILQQRL